MIFFQVAALSFAVMIFLAYWGLVLCVLVLKALAGLILLPFLIFCRVFPAKGASR